MATTMLPAPYAATAADLHVRHGYTMRDLEQMSRAAVIADRSLAADIQTRKDTAWSAIVEALFEAETRPDRRALVQAGWQAIYQDARDGFRQRGRPDEAWTSWDGKQPYKPRFVVYWQDFEVTPSPEHRIVEGLAARQVLDVLTPLYRDALIALAIHDDYRLAAAALGIKDKAFQQRIIVARRRVLAAWFEGETPRKVRRTDRRVGAHGKELATHCSRGHEWTPENTRIRQRFVRGKLTRARTCKECERIRDAQKAAKRRGGQP